MSTHPKDDILGNVAHWLATVTHALTALEAEMDGEAWTALKALERELEVAKDAPADNSRGAVGDQRAMAQVANAVESLRAGKISAMSAWQAVVDVVDRRGGQ